MIPFLYFDLKAVIRNLLDIVIEPVLIEACDSGKQFKEIDLLKKGNLLPLSKINLGFHSISPPPFCWRGGQLSVPNFEKRRAVRKK